MDKRYQVFVSSTYADLEVERRAVIQTIIELDCIPAGMELFPAVDEEQLQFIKRVIDDCDYYLLIIGGRYGSTSSDGVSYTEMEYDYAVSRGLRIVALIHGSPDDIPFGKSERDPALREKLERFKEKVSTGRLVKFWTSAGELPGLVALSLSKTIKTYPAVGWVRANRVSSEEVLSEVNDLRKENDRLREVVAAAVEPAPLFEDLAELDDPFTLRGTYTVYSGSRGGHQSHDWSKDTTWREMFGAIAPYLSEYPRDSDVKGILKGAIYKGNSSSSLDDQVFQTVALQLQALGLVKREYLQTTGGGRALFWSITPVGEAEMLKLRLVRKTASR